VTALNNTPLLFAVASSETLSAFMECLYFSSLSFASGTPEGLSPVGAFKYSVMIETVLASLVFALFALFAVFLAGKLIL